MRSTWLLLLLALLSPGAPAIECPQPLRIAFLDKAIPSKLEGDGTKFASPPGRFVDWLDETLRRMGCAAERVRVPQRRLLVETANDMTQVTFYFAHTAERAQQLVYPTRTDGQPERQLALAETRLALFVRADRQSSIRWDGAQLLPPRLKVGIVGGGVEEPLARAAGWDLDVALSHAGSIAKLRLGRVDAAVLPQLSFSEQALHEEPALVALEPPMHRIHFFAPVSRALHARHPQFVKLFWRTLCEVARSDLPHGSPMPTCRAE
ncbi:MAG: hypothetical protein J0L58_08925 [Burkholderiales bacterium]|uniref:hypothetical protein n=1 Tax=Inhella sp. TaxID=1921806 RepID=UPI001ACE6B03|nr:hypothetical protein [Burkholderiales bacterium]